MKEELPILLYQEHATRLIQIPWAIGFALKAVQNREEELRNNETQAPGMAVIDSMLKTVADLHSAQGTSTGLKAPPEQVFVNEIANTLVGGYPATEILLNLGLVMLCTQLELFLNHLIDIILRAEPRRLMDLASEKGLSGREIIELGDYHSVMRRLRDKVIDEIDRAGTREKFEKHYGKRFRLLQPCQIRLSQSYRSVSSNAPENWDLGTLVEVFDQRHEIVHEGALPVRHPDYLQGVGFFFNSIQTLLAINAVMEYGIRLESGISVGLARGFGKLTELPAAYLDEFQKKALQILVSDGGGNSQLGLLAGGAAG